jgi:hypothetical protein
MGDLDAGRKSGNRLIHSIVNDLVGQMVQPQRVRVHPKPSFESLEP